MIREQIRPFKALSDPNRIRIMKMLTERELCLCEVREVLGLSNSTVSRHLSILRDAGLILDSKDGKWVNFRLNGKPDSSVVRSTIALIRGSFEDDETIQHDRAALRRVDRKTICAL